MCPEEPLPGTLLLPKDAHMTSTPCQSAALDRIIVAFFAIIAEIVLTIAEILRTTLPELGAWLSWPMLPKFGPEAGMPGWRTTGRAFFRRRGSPATAGSIRAKAHGLTNSLRFT